VSNLGGRPRFVEKARERGGLLGESGEKHLDGGQPPDHGVLGEVHGAHAALSQLADDFVAADLFVQDAVPA
jgi:hypothetical protein